MFAKKCKKIPCSSSFCFNQLIAIIVTGGKLKLFQAGGNSKTFEGGDNTMEV